MTATGPRAAATLLPSAPGVYRFRDGSGRALYVGRAVDLRRRVASYWTGAPELRGLGRMVARIAAVEALECDSDHEAAWLERNLLERSQPWWNRMAGGLETPVAIAVIGDPRRPAVRVVHEHGGAAVGGGRLPPGTVFAGPYLGGDRARLAVAGLLRSAPLHLAGTRRTGAERALGEAVGVGPDDRERLLALVVGVLRRDPAAVAALAGDLGSRQAVAVDRLDFEMAAVIRDELAAIRWVTARQRVTDPGTADATLAGWCDGWLVSLSIHAGRLDEWRVRPATARAAGPRIAATPPAWRPFVDRAAALAARLRAGGG
jgi:excinuclease ABC subunit C